MGGFLLEGKVVWKHIEAGKKIYNAYALCGHHFWAVKRSYWWPESDILSEWIIRANGGCLGLERRRRTWLGCDKRRWGVEQPLTRRFPNGGTQHCENSVIPAICREVHLEKWNISVPRGKETNIYRCFATEARNLNIDNRNKFKIPDSNKQNVLDWACIYILDIVSDFEFRISDFRCKAAVGIPLVAASEKGEAQIQLHFL